MVQAVISWDQLLSLHLEIDSVYRVCMCVCVCVCVCVLGKKGLV